MNINDIYCVVTFEPYHVFQLHQLQQFQAGNATGRPHGQSVTFTLPPHSTAAPVSAIEHYKEARWCNALHFLSRYFSFSGMEYLELDRRMLGI